MKKRAEKPRKTLRPSPNEAANILQTEKEKRKKIRLKQIREQEKAFSRKVLEDGRRRKTAELNHITKNLKNKWKEKQDEKQSDLEQKYQENLAEVGGGHRKACEDHTNYNKSGLSEEEKQRLLKASERYKKALEQLTYNRAKSTKVERERSEARAHALEIERIRAAEIAALPLRVDPVKDIFVKRDSRTEKQKSAPVSDSYTTSRFHLHPSVQEDARQAAKEEEERIQVIMEEVQRDKAEQVEKARLRHKHALAQLQLEEDHKNLMEELNQLERCDRQRRQDAVAKIPVSYMGDLAVALGRPERVASEDSIQSAIHKVSEEAGSDEKPPGKIPTNVGPNVSSETPQQSSDKRKEPEEVHLHDKGPKVPPEDPLRRLLQKIERQRDQWKSQQLEKDDAHSRTAGTSTGLPQKLPLSVPSSGIKENRVPETVPVSASPESLTERNISVTDMHEIPEVGRMPHFDNEDKAEISNETKRFQRHLDHGHTPGIQGGDIDVPQPSQSQRRTLFHPLEAARRSFGATSSEVVPSAQLTQQDALLEQEKLKLRLQQQTLRQQQLEQELQYYHKQLTRVYGHAEVPTRSLEPGLDNSQTDSLVDSSASRMHHDMASSQGELLGTKAIHSVGQPHAILDHSDSAQESSPLMSEALNSSTVGSVTSDETERQLPSEFKQTLADAQATADKAAQLSQREKNVLDELHQVAENDPFCSHALPERDSPSVSTPSTLSLSVTMPSELSLTSAVSQTSQTMPVRFFTHPFSFASQRQPPFTDIGNAGTTKSVTSLHTKTSPKFGFSRPLASVTVSQHASYFPTVSYQTAQTSGGSPSALHVSGSTDNSRSSLASYQPAQGIGSGVSQQPEQSSASYFTDSGSRATVATPLGDNAVYNSVTRSGGVSKSSAVLQQSSLGYSPGYIDYYQKMIEEERQLFEEQRNRIQHYSDLLKNPQEVPGAQTHLASQTISKYDPSELNSGLPTYLGKSSEGVGAENKENHGYVANSDELMRQDRLLNVSKRLDAFEKSLSTSVSSRAGTSVSFVSKPLSKDEGSFGSSEARYSSFPPKTIGLGSLGSAGSTLSSLSELTEMITKLTSSSDETEESSLKEKAVGDPQSKRIALETNTKTGLGSDSQCSFSWPARDFIQGGPAVSSLYNPSQLSFSPTNAVTNLAYSQAPIVSVPRTRWTRGSDGKPWYVLSRSSTLSSVGGLFTRDNISTLGNTEDNVFTGSGKDNVHTSGSMESGSISSLPSSTFHTDSEEQGNLPSTFSSATNGSN
ncbi:Centrosomal protein of 295 kDa [Acropora cervicornis]|uniref:Centrosomal protein of 295 kDa n=1 Tax=Acropora cervicornis TaxID=6130 RepID=A0AAD9R5L0_ACRCE|nr:Centrosomal protein of 295 kDa [Acropora cervicornis]